MFIQSFKGGAGRNYHLQDKSLPTQQQVAEIAPHFHNILDRREVMLSKGWLQGENQESGFDAFMSHLGKGSCKENMAFQAYSMFVIFEKEKHGCGFTSSLGPDETF